MPGFNEVKAIITGTTGMVGKGVLFECLADDRVKEVLIINRTSLGIDNPKLKELLVNDYSELKNHQDKLKGYNACFFCLGISSLGISEEAYHKITYDLTINFAKIFIDLNPNSIFCYVSGTGTDSSEKGRVSWARTKGKTENTIINMPFNNSYMFRPGYIQPMKGIKSKTKWYNYLYVIFKPLYPLLKTLFPNQVTSTVKVGQAMINAVLHGYSKKHLENKEINVLANL